MNKNYIIAVIILIIFSLGIYIFGAKGVVGVNNSSQVNDMKENSNNTTMTQTENSKSNMIAQNGDLVFVHYTGKFIDGKVFDTSITRGAPIPFTLGTGAVISGWEKGILGMKIGEKKTLRIAPEDAYGSTGVKNPQTGEIVIPENATLVFDVELMDIQRQ